MERCHQEWDAGLIPGGVFFVLYNVPKKPLGMPLFFPVKNGEKT